MKNQANQSQNKSFKPTPIPHRTKSGEPMAYYILSEDGAQEFKVTRAECLARSEDPEEPFPQRWYVDEEVELIQALYYQGISMREYAKSIDVAEGTVRYRHKQVLKKLRQFFEE